MINGTKYFCLETFQNYLVFIPAKKYNAYFHATTRTYLWKSNRTSEESTGNITKSDSNFAPTFVDHHSLPNTTVNGHRLKQNVFIPKKVINLHISYTLDPQLRNKNTDFTLSNSLFGSAKLTKNIDPDKYKYNGYGIGFDSRSGFSFTDGSKGRNVIILGVDVRSSRHVDNKGKYFLILLEGPTQGLNHALTEEAKYPNSFTQSGIRFVLSLHYYGSNSFSIVNARKYINSKQNTLK